MPVPLVDDAPDRSTDSRDAATEEEEALRCRRCGVDFASPSDVFPGSRSLHVNPGGWLHEIVTVVAARNLAVLGQPTVQDTWFPGYAWDIASCAGCGAHIGWRFEGARSPPSFWGLRTACIV